MVKVRDLLRFKGSEVWSVSPFTSTCEALALMAEKDIGALLVLEGEAIAGIISERDFVRQMSTTQAFDPKKPVREIMTKEVRVVHPDQTITECMQMMTNRHIRHLPVVDDGKLLGLISIGDVVKEVISNQEVLINNLENYIEGRGYIR